MASGIGLAVGWKVSSGFGRSTLHFADAFFHLLARLEGNDELLWHEDFIASARVPGLASSPAFYLENAEIPQLNAVIFHERLDDRIESLLDDFLGLQLREPD